MKKLRLSVNLALFCVLLFCLNATHAMGAAVVTAKAIPGSCPLNGKIEVTATGTVGTAIRYALKKQTDSSFPFVQESNVFQSLPSGVYIAAVYDESEIPILSNVVTLSNNAYSPMSVANTSPGNTLVTGCNDDGSIAIIIAGGNAPFTFKLNGPVTREYTGVTYTSVSDKTTLVKFEQLPSGTYSIDITDDCGSIITKSNISVISKYNLAGKDLAVFELGGGTFLSPTGCDIRITLPSANIMLQDSQGNVLFKRSSGSELYSGYPAQMRMEYPSGSGQYTPWQTVGALITLPGDKYSPLNLKYKLQFKNPCNEADIVTSPEYLLPLPYTSQGGFCAPSVFRSLSGYNCGQVGIVVTKLDNPAATRTFTWDGSTTSYPLDLSGLPAGTYSVKIKVKGEEYQSNNVASAATSTPAIPNTAFILNYYSNLGCDFSTGGIRSYGIKTDNTVPITYSIISGPVTREPVVGTQSMDLWTDLPSGTYEIKFQFGECGTATRKYTLLNPYSGFEAEELSYKPGSSCGKYIITGKGWYLDPAGSVSTSTEVYSVAVLKPNSEDQAGPRAIVPNNTSFEIGPEVAPGTYRVGFVRNLHSLGKCFYLYKTITIPPYVPVSVDIDKSGGFACDKGGGDIRGNLHIEPKNGSGRALEYRIKPVGSGDGSYTSFQSSPDFINIPYGTYTVQIHDLCEYTVTQEVALSITQIVSGISVTGAEFDTQNRQARACKNSNVTLRLNIVGISSNEVWKKPDGTEVNGKDLSINNFVESDQGKYYINYESGGCDHVDSVIFTIKPRPSLTTPLTGIVCSGQVFSYVPESTTPTASTAFNWSRATVPGIQEPASSGSGSINETLTNTSANAINVTYRYQMSYDGCDSTQSVVVNVKPVATPTTIHADGLTICTGSDTLLVAQIATPGLVLNPVFNWYSSQNSLTPIYTGTDFRTGILTATATRDTSFYVSVSGNNYCENLAGNRKEVKVTVQKMTELKIQTSQNLTLCHNSNITLNAVATGNILWYGWYDSKGQTENTRQYAPDPHSANVVYNPDPEEAGTQVKLFVRARDLVCGYMSDTIRLQIMPNPTKVDFELISQPTSFQAICTDTVYELKVKASDLGDLKHLKINLHDINATGIAIHDASFQHPYNTGAWTTLSVLSSDATGTTWSLPNNLVSGDSLKVRINVAAECDFFSGSSVEFNLNASTICDDAVPVANLASEPFYTELDDGHLNAYIVSGELSQDIVTNNTSDTITWRMVAVVDGDIPTDAKKESMQVLIPAGLNVVPNSYVQVKNAPARDSLQVFVDEFGVEFKIPIRNGLVRGDSIIAELQFTAKNAPCKKYDFYSEVIYSDTIECGGERCEFSSTRGGFYPELLVERYKFSLGDTVVGKTTDGLWYGVIPVKAETPFYAGDSIFIDFYVDRNTDFQITGADTLVRSFTYITKNVAAQDTFVVAFDSVHVEKEKQLLAKVRGGVLCSDVIIPLAVLTGIDEVCQSDTALYYTTAGMQSYRWNVIKPDGLTGATPKRIPLENSTTQNYINENIARVIWPKEGNYTVWAAYTMPLDPPQETQRTFFDVKVNVRPFLVLTAGIDTTICEGSRVELSHFFRDTTSIGTLSFYKQEVNGDYTLISSNSPLYVQPTETTTYKVSAISAASGCGSSNELLFKINVNKMPQIASVYGYKQPGCGENTGSIKVEVASGSGSYEYSLNGETIYTPLPADGIIKNLPVGNYRVYIRDLIIGSCSPSISEPVNLSAGNNDMSVAPQTTNASDCSSTDGSITITVSGGTSPYRYKIGNGSYIALPGNGIIGNNFSSGTYDIQIMDATGCENAFGEVVVGADNGLSMTLNQALAANCRTNGMARITLSGGVPGYSYQLAGKGWVTMNAASDSIMLSAGLHKISAKDANGCEITKTISIDNSGSDLSMSLVSIVNAPCDGIGSGGVRLNVSGGAAPLTYSMDGGKTNVNIVAGNILVPGLSVGFYQILLTDANNCTSFIENIEIKRNSDFVQAVNNKEVTYKNQRVDGYLLYDDYESQHLGLKIATFGTPLHGSVTVKENGSFKYTPALDFVGKDSVQYSVSNECGFTKSAWLFIDVLDMEISGNRAPIALNDMFSTSVEQPINNFKVSSNDLDPDGDVLTMPVVVSDVSHGALVRNPDGTFNYTPHTNYAGIDSFTYKVCDPGGLCDEAQVVISILSVDVVNNYISAAPDAYITAKFDTLRVTDPVAGILSNDKYPSGSLPAITILDAPLHGKLILNPTNDGTFTYIPSLYYSGPDVFRYLLCTNGPEVCDTAQVNIFVTERKMLTGAALGDTVVCNGGEAHLYLKFTGNSPWSFTYRINNEGAISVTNHASDLFVVPNINSLTSTTKVTLLTLSDATMPSGLILKETATAKTYAPLSGEYIVGDVPGADFATLKEASIIYNNCGIVANSVLKVSSNIQEIQSVEFLGTAPGSTLHTLRITSDGTRRLVWGNFNDTALIQLTAANNIIIDGLEAAKAYNIYIDAIGNKLAFSNTAETNPLALNIQKDALNNRGKNVYIANSAFTTGSQNNQSYGIKVTTDSVTVEGCHIFNASVGLLAEGVISGTFDSNVVREILLDGISVFTNGTADDGRFWVRNNDVGNVGSSGLDAKGIYMEGVGTIWANTVSNIAGDNASGIYSSHNVPGSNEYLLIANNMVSEIKGASSYGIYLKGLVGKQYAFQNTVRLLGDGTGTQTVNVGFEASAGSDIQIKNNILINPDVTGAGFLYESNAASAVVPSFSNNIYEVASGNFGVLGGLTYEDLVSWNAASGDNSRIKGVEFVSDVDLHLSGASLNDNELRAPLLKGIVDTDFDAERRSVCTNFAGADVNPLSQTHYTTTWQPLNGSTDWTDLANWSDRLPDACTNVIIPAGLDSYPILNQSDEAICDTIFFRFGGEVAKTHFLNYSFAKVDLSLKANRWYFLAPVLQQMYSGDYLSDLSVARINPEIFIMYYQMDNPQTGQQKVGTKFSGLFNNTDERLGLCSGHAIWVDNGTRPATDVFDIHYPKDSLYYNYYNGSGAVVKRSGRMERDNIGRFIYEGSTSYQSYMNGTFKQTIPNSDLYPQLIIGNPFASHLDIVKFQEVNAEFLKKKFYIWGGQASYEAYTIDDAGNVISTDGSGENGIMIPPMQSFIIDTEKLFSDSLTFNVDMSVTQPGKTLRSSVGGLAPDVLRLELSQNGVRQSGMAIHYKNGASRHYDKNKDAWTVLPRSFGSYVSLHAVVDSSALSIYTTGDFANPIDLGISVGKTIKKAISSGEKPEYSIRIVGTETRFANSDVYLLDEELNRLHNLTNQSYVFQNTTGDLDGRFKVYVTPSQTGIKVVDDQGILIMTRENGDVWVKSLLGTPLRAVVIYDLQGKVLYQNQDVNAPELLLNLNQGQLTWVLVKASTEKKYQIKKIHLK